MQETVQSFRLILGDQPRTKKRTGSPTLLTEQRSTRKLHGNILTRGSNRKPVTVDPDTEIVELYLSPIRKDYDVIDHNDSLIRVSKRSPRNQQEYLKGLAHPRPVTNTTEATTCPSSLICMSTAEQRESCDRLSRPRTYGHLVKCISVPALLECDTTENVENPPGLWDNASIPAEPADLTAYCEDLTLCLPPVQKDQPERVSLLRTSILHTCTQIKDILKESDKWFPNVGSELVQQEVRLCILPTLLKRSNVFNRPSSNVIDLMSLIIQCEPSELCLVRLQRLKRDLLQTIRRMCKS
jgi:hypothetical protein